MPTVKIDGIRVATTWSEAAASTTYTVTYNGNGNTGGTAPVDGSSPYSSGATVTVLGNTGGLIRNSFTFVGWNTQADGNGTDYPASGSATFTMGSANLTLFAKWTGNSYTVTYDGNGNTGGTVPLDNNPYTSGAVVTVMGNTDSLVKPAYVFAGWNTASDGSGTSYIGGDTFTIVASTTLYATWTAAVLGNLTIFHENDVHARVTPHYWVVPTHTANPTPTFELVGGAAYLAGKMLSLVASTPDALVLDGGDISEGNPVGDWNGPGTPIGTYGDGTTVDFFTTYNNKLKNVSGRGGRGLDAMVVGNHDIRDISYINNMKAASANFPILSINICKKGTHTPYFAPYTFVNVNGHTIGIVGYTTETSDSPEAEVNNLIDVVKCDWSSSDSTKIHFADYVNDLRNNHGCDIVILLTHDGHQDLCTSSGTPATTPILVDNAAAKLPEIAITGHWHTYADSVWQPEILNYKTIFAEAGSYMHYISELRVDGFGRYISSTNYPLRNSNITPDPDILAQLNARKAQYDAAIPSNPTVPQYTSDQVVGYSADNLYLDNYMKWWSADEYPWSGNNTAGNWICDAVQFKAAHLFGTCDVAIESGGGVRSDIRAGPITFSQIYETYPWADDVIWEVNMTGQEIYNYIRKHNCDVGISHDWLITALDGNPTGITYNGQPIGLGTTYKVAINNYMYAHDSVPFSDPNPQKPATPYLARTALIDYTATFAQDNPYHAGDSRYSLNGEFSGAYTAVVTMMNDADAKEYFDYAFLRLLYATNETMGHYGTRQVPASLVNPDGSVNQGNRLAETELYRSYLGFRTNVLKPGDIIVTYGKSGFYGGNPEFVDQEGITADGVEFKIVGHDDSLAGPNFVSSISTALDDFHKNHYIKFLARKTDTSTVADQAGTALGVQDATAYNSKTLPGNVGDLLLLTGVPTSENYGMRFRCSSAVLASSAGFTDYPPTSQIDPVAYLQTAPVLHLTAQAMIIAPSMASVTPSDDTSVQSGHPTTTGNSTQMFVQSASPSDSFGNERTWVKFNTSSLSLPANATVNQVLLRLYCFNADASSDLPVEVRGETDGWTEPTLDWNGQPALGGVLDTETLFSGSVNLYYNFDVTAFANAQLAGDGLASFVIKAVNESSPTAVAYRFDSKEYSGGANAPLLEFHYTVSPPPATGVQSIDFQYRSSADNVHWSAWTSFATTTTAPYAADFTYPGPGFYQFQSISTGVNGMVEPAPVMADTSVLFNAIPVPGPYQMGCQRNSSATLAVAKLLKAASDPAGGTLSVTAVAPSSPQHCTVTLDSANGIITYTPSLDFAGPDSFTYTLTDNFGASAQGTVTVQVDVANGQGPSVLGITSVGNGATVRFAGIPGLVYTIEASSDLSTWTSIGTAQAAPNGLFQIDDPNASNFQTRYYRARYQ